MNNFKEAANKTLNQIFDMVEKNYEFLEVDFEDENLKIEKDEKVFIKKDTKIDFKKVKDAEFEDNE